MEEFVTFDIANKLKEKGFDEPTMTYYKDGKIDWSDGFCHFNITGRLSAPTISQVLKWLREEKKLFVDIGMAYNKYFVGICKTDEFDEVVGQQVIEHAIGTPSNTYEEAAIAGVNYCLESLI